MSTIEISKQQYRELLKAEYKLTLLDCFGVDNWDGYYEALSGADMNTSYSEYCKILDEEYPDE